MRESSCKVRQTVSYPLSRGCWAAVAVTKRLSDHSDAPASDHQAPRLAARSELDVDRDGGFSSVRHGIHRRGDDSDHQQGQGRQSRGVRRDEQAPGSDWVGVTGCDCGTSMSLGVEH